MAKRGFTLAELLITVVILAVLAAIALPSFGKAIEKGKWNEALANLRAIAVAEKMYFLKNGICVICPINTTDVKTKLGVDVTDGYFKYNVAACAAPGCSLAFIATATTPWAGAKVRTISLDQNGSITYTNRPAYINKSTS